MPSRLTIRRADVALALIAYLVFDGLSHGWFDLRWGSYASLTAFATLVCLVLVVTEGVAERRRFDRMLSPAFVVLAIFIGVVAVSASTLGAGFDFSFAKNLIIASTIIMFVRDGSGIRVVLGAAAVAGIVQLGFGAAQLVSQGMPAEGLTGFLPNHVQYGLYLSVSAIAAFPLVHASKDLRVRSVGYATIALIGIGSVASLARGAVLSAAGAVLVTAAAVMHDRKRVVLVALAVTIALTAIIGLSGRFSELAELPQAVGDVEKLDSLLTSRLQFLVGAWNMFEESPVFGAGYGRYREVWYQYVPEDILNPWSVGVPFAAHSTYLQIMAEMGLVGLVTYLLVLGTSLVTGVKASRRATGTFVRLAAASAVGCVLVFAFHGLLDNGGWHDRPFYVFVALCVAVWHSVRDADGTGEGAPAITAGAEE